MDEEMVGLEYSWFCATGVADGGKELVQIIPCYFLADIPDKNIA